MKVKMTVLQGLLTLSIIIFFSCRTINPESTLNADSNKPHTTQSVVNDNSQTSGNKTDEDDNTKTGSVPSPPSTRIDSSPSESKNAYEQESKQSLAVVTDTVDEAEISHNRSRAKFSMDDNNENKIPKEDTPRSTYTNRDPAAGEDFSNNGSSSQQVNSTRVLAETQNTSESTSTTDGSAKGTNSDNSRTGSSVSGSSNNNTDDHFRPGTSSTTTDSWMNNSSMSNSTQSKIPVQSDDSVNESEAEQDYIRQNGTSDRLASLNKTQSAGGIYGTGESSPPTESEQEGIYPETNENTVPYLTGGTNRGTIFEPDSIQQEEKDDLLRSIMELIRLITARKYNKWNDSLTDSYKEKFNSPDFLKKLSESPKLAYNGITLRTLKDYFHMVVVPSRYSVVLEKIELIGNDRAIVYTVFKGKYAKLFQLMKIDGEWRIAEW